MQIHNGMRGGVGGKRRAGEENNRKSKRERFYKGSATCWNNNEGIRERGKPHYLPIWGVFMGRGKTSI